MNGPEKSDSPVVSKKRANNAGLRCPAAEPVEKRGLAEGNPEEQTNRRTQCRARLQQALRRIRQAVGTTLARHYLRQEPCAVIPPAGICAGAAGQPAVLPRPGLTQTSR